MPFPEHQNRWTVFLRLLLLIPQYIVLAVLSIVAVITAIVGWFAALVLGRLPSPIRGFLTGFLRYDTRVNASMMLLTDRYPPFRLGEVPGYPVRIDIAPVHLNRLAVFFRILLMIPAMIIQAIVSAGWWSVAFISWLVVLIMGRMPEPLFEATSAILRYRMRLGAYSLMLASSYPKRLFGDAPEAAWSATPAPAAAPAQAGKGPDEITAGSTSVAARSATRPLRVGTAGKVLIGVFIVLGLGSVAANSANWSMDDDDGWSRSSTFR
ncbi:DUF4389 domain-containing protein [Yinghuangia sp. YIM S09857]|uniref:DUF4389 domain-containing protein n=1 Tax=Yinghuangia sp. YIM S09857 TaxID=3436929 RepID=UPI003F538B30